MVFEAPSDSDAHSDSVSVQNSIAYMIWNVLWDNMDTETLIDSIYEMSASAHCHIYHFCRYPPSESSNEPSTRTL